MTDDDLNELAYSAHAEAMSFGLSHDTFLRYFKTIRERATAAEKDRCIEAVKAVGPKDGPLKLVSDGFVAAITAGVMGTVTLPTGDVLREGVDYEARHTTQCKHYDNNCGAVHPSNCPDCPFRTGGVSPTDHHTKPPETPDEP